MTAVKPPGGSGTGNAIADDGAGLAERLSGLLDGLRRGAVSLVAATVPAPALDPIALVAAAIEADLEIALWLRPAEGTAFVGIGRAWATEPSGPDRFREAETAWRTLVADARLDRAGTGARGSGPVLLGALGFTGRPPAVDDPWGPFGASSLVLPELLLTVTPDGAALTGSLTGVPAGSPVAAGSITGGDARALERRWERLVERARALAPSPSGMVARPVFAPLAVTDQRPAHDHWRRLVGMFAGAVGRGRIDKVVLARRVGYRSPRGARRPERTPAPRRERAREHDLRLPTSRADVPRRHPGAARPDGRSILPDRCRGRDDRPGRRRGRGRGTGASPPRIREGPRGARDRRLRHPGPADPDRGRAHRGARAVGHDPPLRPAPGHPDRRHAARRARPAGARGASPPHARGRRTTARHRACARRRARGVRSRLVRGSGGLAGRRRRRRAVRGPALRDRGRDDGDAVRRLRHRGRLRPGPRMGGVPRQAARRHLGAGDPGEEDR